MLEAKFSYLLATSDYNFDGETLGGSLMPFMVGAQYRF